MTHVIVVGTSEPQDFLLTDAVPGSADPEPIDGQGIDIGLEIERYENGTTVTVTTPPTVAWLDAANGTVRVTGVADLAVGTYLVRYKLTDGGGAISFVPNQAKSDVWQVVPIANR